MDMAKGELRPAFHQDNVGLLESDSSLENSTAMTDTIRSTNGYQNTGDMLTLPYSEVTYQIGRASCSERVKISVVGI